MRYSMCDVRLGPDSLLVAAVVAHKLRALVNVERAQILRVHLSSKFFDRLVVMLAHPPVNKL